MNRVIAIIFCLVLAFKANAQMDVEAMIEQISALEGYIKTAEKGYKIVEEGLQTIGQIKNGEFNLHSVFFSSLKSVNPQVDKMGQVAEILAIQISLAEQISKSVQSVKQNKWLQSDEISYITKVYSTILTDIVDDVTDLLNVTTDGTFEMSDGERISRIQAIDNNARSQSMLVQNFSKQTNLLARQRQLESLDNEAIMNFYGNP